MEQFYYLGSLLFSLGGLALADWRFRLAFFADSHRTIKVIGIAMLIFIAWDALGIVAGIFFHGDSPYDLPFTILPEFPLEELFFLFLLNYVTLLLYLMAERRWRRTS
ncbi:lycopene cyclase domain-containing protein [Candidatus Saccharibacteria bacterium]|nr:lycopene cyclase domain-containing protein [Candidatus Saccharibacteria bacterium]